MKRLLQTLDVLRLLEEIRAEHPLDTALIRETIAQCQDKIAQMAGYRSRTEWAARLLAQDNQREALALCRDQVDRAGYAPGRLGRTSFDVSIHGKTPDALRDVVSQYPDLEVWVPDEPDWELCTITIKDYG